MHKVTVAIAAYKAENNILKLLNSLATQSRRNFTLEEILVHCDGEEDGTAHIVRQYSLDSRIPVRLIETTHRGGYARAMQTIFANATGEVLITLNDDIEVRDTEVLSMVVDAFQADARVAMVTGRPAYVESRTYFGRALASVQRAYLSSQYDGASRNTAKTVDGKLMAFSRSFYSGFRFPEVAGLVGNVDCFMYFSVRAAGYSYVHAYNAVVYGRNPESIADYVQFSVRCEISNKLLAQSFDKDFVALEYKRNRKAIIQGLAKEALRNPFGLLLVFSVNKYIQWKIGRTPTKFSPVWELVKTARRLQ